MKSIIIFVIILFSSALYAQVPHIDYMMADEAKSQLQIHGTFSSDTTGFVTIENTKQIVRSWTDTLIISDLPDSGAGSGGHVTATQMTGTSNARMLSIFKISIRNPIFTRVTPLCYQEVWDFYWFVSWRADIGFRNPGIDTTIKFEISKTSYGRDNFQPTKYWNDSSNYKEKGISLKGIINLQDGRIFFEKAYFVYDSVAPANFPNINTYQLKSINFDTIGVIYGYRDSGTDYNFSTRHWDDTVVANLLFPPGIKNAVKHYSQSSSDIIIILMQLGSNDHLISIEAEVPLGETTASLYSIDGRVLKEEKINIPFAGRYLFDAKGININFGFLVLKTSKGVVAKKVIF